VSVAPTAGAKLVRRLLVAVLALHVGAGLLRLAPVVRHARDLAAAEPAARGAIAADERRSPWVGAGEVRYRERVAEAAGQGRAPRSAVAYSWEFLTARRDDFAAGDRVIVDPPSTIPYFYASFLWYPTAVELGPRPGVVRDEASVAAARLALPEGGERAARLAAMGYTHRLIADRRGLTLERLPAPAAAGEGR
jgi:hypothetical protein